MTQPLDEVGAAIHFLARIRIRFEPRLGEEGGAPRDERGANVEREGDLALLPLLVHRLKRLEVGEDRFRVLVADLGVPSKREGRIQVFAFVADAVAERLLERVVIPFADAGLRIRRQIRRHDEADRGVEAVIAGKGLATGRGVTGHAIARRHEIFAAFDQIRIARLSEGRPGREEGGEGEPAGAAYGASCHEPGLPKGDDPGLVCSYSQSRNGLATRVSPGCSSSHAHSPAILSGVFSEI